MTLLLKASAPAIIWPAADQTGRAYQSGSHLAPGKRSRMDWMLADYAVSVRVRSRNA
jgi:hypothetical protein